MFAECDEFCLRVIVAVAEEDKSLAQIQAKTKIPAQQLPGIIHLLSDHHLITCNAQEQYSIKAAINELSLYDILNTIRPWQRWSACPVDVEDHQAELCPLHRRLENISNLVERQLRATTIASLLNDPSQRKPLCNKLQ